MWGPYAIIYPVQLSQRVELIAYNFSRLEEDISRAYWDNQSPCFSPFYLWSIYHTQKYLNHKPNNFLQNHSQTGSTPTLSLLHSPMRLHSNYTPQTALVTLCNCPFVRLCTNGCNSKCSSLARVKSISAYLFTSPKIITLERNPCC